MDYKGPEAKGSQTAASPAGPTGLTAENKVALTEALSMRGNGATAEAAVNHLVASGMPRIVAKVLMKQYDRTSETDLLKHVAERH